MPWSESPWNGDQPWQRVLGASFERWMDRLGARDRVPAGWEQAMARDPHEKVLCRVGLTYEGKFEFWVRERWSVESLIGYIHSTSFLNGAVLGRHATAFDDDVRSQLLACCPDGVFDQDLSFAYELTRRIDSA